MAPLASSTTSSTTRSFSLWLSVGASPVVPHGDRKWTPASICRRARRLTPASSTEPSFLKGVTRAVPTPENGVRISELLSVFVNDRLRRLQDVGHGEPAAASLDPSRRHQR